jgi:multisubunit Na+/H+ antiporter MnhE subunit
MPTGDRRLAPGTPRGRHQALSRHELVRAWLVCWLLCAGVWMVLDDTIALPELIDGAVAATLGASAATLVRARSHVQFARRPGWMRLCWRPVVHLISDLPELARVLARTLAGGHRDPGRVRSVAFAVSGAPRARATQVALASVTGSVAPSTVIIAVDEDAGRLIFHELSAREDRARADPLELG